MSALDYLLKPVNLKELKDAVARAEEKNKSRKVTRCSRKFFADDEKRAQ